MLLSFRVSPRLAVYLKQSSLHILLCRLIVVRAALGEITLVAQNFIKAVLSYLETALREYLGKFADKSGVGGCYDVVVELDFWRVLGYLVCLRLVLYHKTFLFFLGLNNHKGEFFA